MPTPAMAVEHVAVEPAEAMAEEARMPDVVSLVETIPTIPEIFETIKAISVETTLKLKDNAMLREVDTPTTQINFSATMVELVATEDATLEDLVIGMQEAVLLNNNITLLSRTLEPRVPLLKEAVPERNEIEHLKVENLVPRTTSKCSLRWSNKTINFIKEMMGSKMLDIKPTTKIIITMKPRIWASITIVSISRTKKDMITETKIRY